jgi:hypothetical protein
MSLALHTCSRFYAVILSSARSIEPVKSLGVYKLMADANLAKSSAKRHIDPKKKHVQIIPLDIPRTILYQS